MSVLNRKSLFFSGPRQITITDEEVASPSSGELLVKTEVSAISPGTEMLFYRGTVPAAMPVDVTIPVLAGTFSYPIKYGYAAVGRVIAIGPAVDPKWKGSLVFSFHPHESHFLAAPDEVIPVPAGLAPEQAVFLPSVETALTLVMDGRPLIGERILVFGQGIIGLLTTLLLSRFPLSALISFDPVVSRRKLSIECGAYSSHDPSERSDYLDLDADLAFELSGNPAALDFALSAVGFAGRIVLGSWYGTKPATLDLGGRFHRSRIRILSSQVSTVGPELSGRWEQKRRMQVAWQLLPTIDTGRFVTHRFPIERAARAYELIDRHPEQTVQALLTYS